MCSVAIIFYPDTQTTSLFAAYTKHPRTQYIPEAGVQVNIWIEE